MSGTVLAWSPPELDIIDRAVATADRAEDVRGLYDVERAGEARMTVLVKLSAEARALDKQVVDLVSRLEFGVGRPKSARHVKAGIARHALKAVKAVN
ncbi:hypothetical protein ASE48_20135 [Mycobacterium sp. Root265]|nr:hypothetical protein ASE48_20135 [Mycobacterium sp. Root265]